MAKRVVNARDPAPHIAAPLDRSVAASIKALARGEAAPEQQSMALNWIISEASGTYESVYFPESVRQSDFASGKRFVGNQIVGIINMPMTIFDEKK
jgi:hypothetical protein